MVRKPKPKKIIGSPGPIFIRVDPFYFTASQPTNQPTLFFHQISFDPISLLKGR